jgi:hypothetical protein
VQPSFDAAGDLVDRLRVGADRVQLTVLAPSRDVRHARAGGVQAERAADDEVTVSTSTSAWRRPNCR